MNKVHKIVLDYRATDYLLPKGAKPLSVAVQRGGICLWYSFDPGIPTKAIQRFYIVGTGHQEVDPKWVFIGTVLLSNDNLVLHIFTEPSDGI